MNLASPPRAARSAFRSLSPGLPLLVFLALAGCRGPGGIGPGRFPSLTGTDTPYSLTELGSAVMGFADDFNIKVMQAYDDISAASTDPQLRAEMLQGKITTANATLAIATSPNPVVALLDMTVYVTLKRSVLETEQPRELPEAGKAELVQILGRGEAEIWKMAGSVLSPQQQEEVRELLRRWQADHPRQRYISHVRFAEFGRYRFESTRETSPRSWSVFQLLYLDPLAGADPVAQEIHETRMLAERLYFYAARIPAVWRWQVELLYMELLLKPESRQVLAGLEKAVATAESLPRSMRQEIDGAVRNAREEIAEERKAAVEQIAGALAKEREAITGALTEQSEALRPLVADLRTTLDAGARMAAAVDGGVKSLDGFVGRFVPVPGTSPEASAVPAAAPGEAGDGGRPFDVLDYGKAAAQIREAAAELRELIAATDRSLADPASPDAAGIRKAASELEAAADRLILHAFLYAVGLVLVLAAALAVTLRLTARTRQRAPSSRTAAH